MTQVLAGRAPSGFRCSFPYAGVEKERPSAVSAQQSPAVADIPYMSFRSTIAVDFLLSGDSVRMVVTLDPMHDEEFTRMSTMGFTSQLTKLDKRFGQTT
jgi:hypothetical protein